MAGGAPEAVELSDLIFAAERIVGFTGAGVSTESGIPDFRSPGGVWTKYDPATFDFARFISDARVRMDSWQMRREFFDAGARPNPAHRAFAHLEQQGVSSGVITQNIDGLHQQAGSVTVLELHGTARDVMCIGTDPAHGTPHGCGWRAPHEWAMDQVDAGTPEPRCPTCTGMVKSATISFGQMLDEEVVAGALTLARSADLFITAGSSLQVQPAASLPLEALDAGADLVIINDEATPLDRLADLVVRGRAGQVLGAAVLNEKAAASDDGERS